MITDVYVVYNDDSQIKELREAYADSEFPVFHFIDSLSNKTKKEAWALKSHWAARLDPFAIIMDGDKALKAFYSETGEDVIKSLSEYLKEYEE